MAGQRRVGGTIAFKIAGEIQLAKGEFTYTPGGLKKTAVTGSDGKVHGYKDEPIVPMIEGVITDRRELKVQSIIDLDAVEISLDLANGKGFILRDAWYAGDGTVKTGEGEIPVKFEGISGVEA